MRRLKKCRSAGKVITLTRPHQKHPSRHRTLLLHNPLAVSQRVGDSADYIPTQHMAFCLPMLSGSDCDSEIAQVVQSAVQRGGPLNLALQPAR